MEENKIETLHNNTGELSMDETTIESRDQILAEANEFEIIAELDDELMALVEENLGGEFAYEGETIDMSSDLEEEDEFNLELDYLDDELQEEKLWQARTGLNTDSLCGAIETIIFMSDRPVTISKIKDLIDKDMPLRVIHDSLSRLQEEYERSHHGLRLLEVAEGYQFRTKATYSKYVQDLFKVNSLVLSPTALEVLAIIAYKQPVCKNEVDKIRGVDSSHIVRGLMDKRLVRVAGRSDEAGRPSLYATTPEFLEVFNLASVDDLPPEHELEEMGQTNVGKISDIKSIVNSNEAKRFEYDEIDELDKLADSIKEIKSDTMFIQSLKLEDKKRKTAEGETVKSAFDLLEEFVDMKLIAQVNKEAANSEMMTAVTLPMVISDLTAGPFNVPETVEEDEEDFQMIDLDTGEPIIEAASEEDEIETIDILGTPESIEEEAKNLSDALDDAFEKLQNDNILSLDSEAELFGEQAVDQKKQELDDLQEDIISKGQDFDLDLSFLNDDDLLK